MAWNDQYPKHIQKLGPATPKKNRETVNWTQVEPQLSLMGSPWWNAQILEASFANFLFELYNILEKHYTLDKERRYNDNPNKTIKSIFGLGLQPSPKEAGDGSTII